MNAESIPPTAPGKGMRIAMILVRSLMGLLFAFASVTYFFKLITPPPLTGVMKVFNDGLEASRYLMPTVKVIELVCGLAFLLGRFVPLASVLIAPIIVNILLISVFLVGPQCLLPPRSIPATVQGLIHRTEGDGASY